MQRIPKWPFPWRSFRTPCDRCGAPTVLIVYGLRDEDVAREVGYENVALGGCMVGDDSPLWCCRECERRLPHGGLGSPFEGYYGGRHGAFWNLAGRIYAASSADGLRDLVPDLVAFEGGRFRRGFAECWRRQWKALQQVAAIAASDMPPTWPKSRRNRR